MSPTCSAPGFVNVGAAALFGIIGSMVCAGAMELMERFSKYAPDDTLDVFAVHGVGEWAFSSFRPLPLNPVGAYCCCLAMSFLATFYTQHTSISGPMQ